ncbi:hypothetical protein GCM10011514_10480 [Emticicia aquatilis]|uniref:Uncharacterized protein n=1 Tax=Emticicia aquatilis TaxID=1537369 RepID=A0A916YKP2_9BACT|nr:hypothetical protein [Emticicia aquatilis]GGD48346.1 hypothetical protein GCM10011514_10480 [Emticicia aquatilis]
MNTPISQKEKKRFKFVGDRERATYRCEIFLRPEHCYSHKDGTGAVMFDGYSKHKFHDEPKDKEKCLTNFVQRIVANGYLEKAYYIAFYTNKNVGKDQDELLLEFNPLQWKKLIVSQRIIQTYFVLNDYLIKLNEIKISTPASKELKPEYAETSKASEIELFKMYKHRFVTKEALIQHCRMLKERKFPQGRVEGFYFAYLNAYPFS